MNSQLETLIDRIESHTAVVGVVGLGYVGLPFAVEKAKVGLKVVGIDRSQSRVGKVNAGENYIKDIADVDLKDVVASGLLRAQTTFEGAADLDVIVIAVPTPLTANLVPDLQYIEAVTNALAPHIRPGQLISLESTTYPGTTEDVMLPILAKSGLKVDEDFFLAHSPERVDPGNKRYSTKNTNKVVGGVGPNSQLAAVTFYKQAIQHVVPVSSAKAAELCKVFENTFRAVNIALVNELLLLCDRMELNVWEVLTAANTKPFGIMPFFPGPGVGGHCIPLDPHYLEWKAKEYNFNTRFIALAGEINRKMPEFVIDKTARILNQRGLALSRSKILVLGIAYKRDLDDDRESPAFEVMYRLIENGVTLTYSDTWIPVPHDPRLNLTHQPLTEELVKSHDLVMILTDHTDVDYSWVASLGVPILDTRNATKNVTENREAITLL